MHTCPATGKTCAMRTPCPYFVNQYSCNPGVYRERFFKIYPEKLIADPSVHHLGANIKIARGRAHMAQRRLAKEVGIALATVQSVENKPKPSIALNNLIAIADVLEVSLDELLGRTPDDYRPLAQFKKRP